MPQVVNGIGTWYYGKQGLTRRSGVCPKCNRLANLSTYDTTLFFTFIFIPLIPLRKYRILDDCSSCRKHTRMPLAKWRELSKSEIGSALLSVEKNPSDPAAAINAINTAVGMRDEPAFVGLTALIEPQAGQNVDVWATLGDGYNFFGHRDAAINAYRRAYQLKPDRAIAQALGVSLIRSGDVDSGWPLIQHNLTEPQQDGAGVVLLAVEGYQAAGRHQQALDLLDQVEKAYPDKALAKDIKRYRKLSQARLTSGRPVPSALIGSNDGGPKTISTPEPGRRNYAWAVGPILALLAIGGWMVASVIEGRDRRVHIVSGVSRPYNVLVAGKKVSLAPFQRITIHIPEGMVKVDVQDPSMHIPTQECEVRTSFLTRPVNGRVFVINPDQMAAMVWEKTEYIPSTENRATSHTSEVRAPALLHTFDAADFLFKPFPQTISLSKSGAVFRTRVDLYESHDPSELIQVFMSELPPEDFKAYLRRGMVRDARTEAYGQMLAGMGNPAEIIPDLQPLLKDRPVNIGAHRNYQSCSGRLGNSAAILTEYREALKAEPDDAALQYLLGRLTDRQEALQLWARAAADPVAGPYALGAIAYDHLMFGQFDQALTTIDRVPAGSDQAARLRPLTEEALHGLGRFQDCLKLPSLSGDLQDLPASRVVDRIYYTQREGGIDQARAVVDQYLSASPEDDSAKSLRRWIEARMAYVEGDAKPMIELAADPDIGGFEDEIAKGDLVAAAERLKKAGDASAYAHILLAIAAEVEANAEIAGAQWTLAAGRLADGSKDERMLSTWLSGAASPGPGAALELALFLPERRLMLAAIAIKFPDRAAECAGLLRTLNFDRRPPYLLLDQVVRRSN